MAPTSKWRIQKRRHLKPLRLHHSNNLVGFNQTSQILQFIHHKSSKLGNVLFCFLIMGLGLVVDVGVSCDVFRVGNLEENLEILLHTKMYRFSTLLEEI